MFEWPLLFRREMKRVGSEQAQSRLWLRSCSVLQFSSCHILPSVLVLVSSSSSSVLASSRTTQPSTAIMDSSSEVSDVFSLSDHLLAERLQFVKEVRALILLSLLLTVVASDRLWKLGQCMALPPKVFLWQCQGYEGCRQACPSLQNLYHCCQSTLIVGFHSRSPFHSTHPRGRARWNEMKIVRSFKNDPHPSIVPFHSFIITPSYALITMSVFLLVLDNVSSTHLRR